jgi:hypothetical protein
MGFLWTEYRLSRQTPASALVEYQKTEGRREGKDVLGLRREDVDMARMGNETGIGLRHFQDQWQCGVCTVVGKDARSNNGGSEFVGGRDWGYCSINSSRHAGV